VADAWFLRGLKAMVAPKPADFMNHPEWRRIDADRMSPYQNAGQAGIGQPFIFATADDEAHLQAGSLEASRDGQDEVRVFRPARHCSGVLGGAA
jgi:hypothetical protein